MFEGKTHEAIRAVARSYERTLPLGKRKQLGQYFTGLSLGKLLAHLALETGTRTIIDPMAGHGDLLDATWEAAAERDITIERLDGIEIDRATAEVCRDRLTHMAGISSAPARKIIVADAFDPESIGMLPQHSYDLVITNPPYVRYQNRDENGKGSKAIRAGLKTAITINLSAAYKELLSTLVDGYSGLADLSVPSWILAAAIVRPGGRLALVVPATWRSRNYADVVRYLMLRCFSLECVVEDQQPGWFSDVLVRTHLIVARKLSEVDMAKPLDKRDRFSEPLWVKISPEAASADSLVGSACTGSHPEEKFASWLYAGCPVTKRGIETRSFDLESEYLSLKQCIRHRRWYRSINEESETSPLFAEVRPTDSPMLPEALIDILPKELQMKPLLSLDEAGITVGQGLRTGCNGFFYVTACKAVALNETVIETSPLFGKLRFKVPNSALRPVLRRQNELAFIEEERIPNGRVFDLRSFVLPKDWETVLAAQEAYIACGEALPQLMPKELVAYVRTAAKTRTGSKRTNKLIPTLSAVRTNSRLSCGDHIVPHFWYMLPKFASRHLPAAFVPRINHGLPWVEANLDPPLLIDANFSTFWALEKSWTRHALKALLNSIWCRASMEALGTSMGGGALKLEATHLRRMSVPVLSDSEKTELDTVGKQLSRDTLHVQTRIDNIVLTALCAGTSKAPPLLELAATIKKRALSLSDMRQRVSS